MTNIAKLYERNRDELDNYVTFAAAENGLLLMSPSCSTIETISCTIFPSPFSAIMFENAKRIQKDFQLLFNKISRDYDVLYKILHKVIDCDIYVKNLWDICMDVRNSNSFQPVFLSLVRNDYMIHVPSDFLTMDRANYQDLLSQPGVSLKQIEYNLMASSFAGLSQRIVPFHRLNARTVGLIKTDDDCKQIPCNKPADGLAKGIICAWKVYNKREAGILFVVGNAERNIFDQVFLQQSIYEQCPEVVVIRKTFEQCQSEGYLDSDGSLWIGNLEIAVIYFRHGYTPRHFEGENIWQCKRMLEMSRAIKCPSIQQMLVNTKLVQQALCDYSLLKKYVPDLVAKDIMEMFASQYLLNDFEKVEEALQSPEKFVLKPQREGGGNNFFDAEMVNKLKEVKDTKEKHEFVLMQRIYSPSFDNFVLKPDRNIVYQRMVSELGIYGVFLGNDTEVYANFECGHLLRSKQIDVNESGIASGFGCLDSLYLV